MRIPRSYDCMLSPTVSEIRFAAPASPLAFTGHFYAAGAQTLYKFILLNKTNLSLVQELLKIQLPARSSELLLSRWSVVRELDSLSRNCLAFHFERHVPCSSARDGLQNRCAYSVGGLQSLRERKI